MIVRNEFQNRFNNLIERLSLQRDLGTFDRGNIPLLYCVLLFPCGMIPHLNNPTIETQIL